MTAAEAWLRERVPGAPPRLLEAMVSALRADDEVSVPEALAEASLGLLTGLPGRGARTGDALPLLASDALLTHALEAQAELDPAGLPEAVERWGARGRIGEAARLLADPQPTPP